MLGEEEPAKKVSAWQEYNEKEKGGIKNVAIKRGERGGYTGNA